jgi:hypothetical protein
MAGRAGLRKSQQCTKLSTEQVARRSGWKAEKLISVIAREWAWSTISMEFCHVFIAKFQTNAF